jgi:hypothetical protein
MNYDLKSAEPKNYLNLLVGLHLNPENKKAILGMAISPGINLLNV